MTDSDGDFWAEYQKAEDAFWASVSQLTLSLDKAIDELTQEWLSKCNFNARLSPESNAFANHFWKCSGCQFCGVLALQQ